MQIDFLGTGGKTGIDGRINFMINQLSPEQRTDLAFVIAKTYKDIITDKQD